MKIFLCLLLIVLVILSSGIHLYFVWKGKDYRTLVTQMGVLGVAIILGILVIYHLTEPSISTLLNTLSPF